MKDLLSLVGQHLPKASLSSLYKLKKCFLDLYDDISFNVHYCCSGCHSPFEDRHSVCLNGCSSTATEFLTIPVEPQLKRKLQSKFSHLCDCLMHSYMLQFPDPTFWGHLQRRFELEKDSESLQDVSDDWEYLKHAEFLTERGNVSFLVNTDGVSLFRSSTVAHMACCK